MLFFFKLHGIYLEDIDHTFIVNSWNCESSKEFYCSNRNTIPHYRKWKTCTKMELYHLAKGSIWHNRIFICFDRCLFHWVRRYYKISACIIVIYEFFPFTLKRLRWTYNARACKKLCNQGKWWFILCTT